MLLTQALAGESGLQPVQIPAPLALPLGHAEGGVDVPGPGLRRRLGHRQDVLLGVLDEGEHRHQQDTHRDARPGQRPHGLQPPGRAGRPGLQLGGQSVVCRGEGQLAQHRSAALDKPEQVDVPDHQIALGGQGDSETIGVQQGQRVPGELELPLKRVVGVAHGPHAYNTGAELAPEVVPQDGQGVLLDPHGIEVLHLIAVAPAVAVDTAVATAPVQIHGVVRAEPGAIPGPVQQMLGRDRFQTARLRFLQCITIRRKFVSFLLF